MWHLSFNRKQECLCTVNKDDGVKLEASVNGHHSSLILVFLPLKREIVLAYFPICAKCGGEFEKNLEFDGHANSM